MQQPNRNFNSPEYRYGFNGKENDNELKGNGLSQDYGLRIYDSRIGRFASVDPLTKDYPQLTPYQFASNTPVQAIDLDGAEAWVVVETDGVGHAFVVVPSEDDTSEFVLYSYGRYLGSTTPSAGGYGPIGPGVLIRKEGESAKEYIKKRLSLGEGESTFVFELPRAEASAIRDKFDDIFEKGSDLPDDSKAAAEFGSDAKVIDQYVLFPLFRQEASNCVTKVCEAIEQGGALNIFSPRGDAMADLNRQIDPKALGGFLKTFEIIDKDKGTGSVMDVTEKTKEAFGTVRKTSSEKTETKPEEKVGPRKEDGTF